jgi:hypothetical protein
VGPVELVPSEEIVGPLFRPLMLSLTTAEEVCPRASTIV